MNTTGRNIHMCACELRRHQVPQLLGCVLRLYCFISSNQVVFHSLCCVPSSSRNVLSTGSSHVWWCLCLDFGYPGRCDILIFIFLVSTCDFLIFIFVLSFTFIYFVCAHVYSCQCREQTSHTFLTF